MLRRLDLLPRQAHSTEKGPPIRRPSLGERLVGMPSTAVKMLRSWSLCSGFIQVSFSLRKKLCSAAENASTKIEAKLSPRLCELASIG
jgi:hypothetical protein